MWTRCDDTDCCKALIHTQLLTNLTLFVDVISVYYKVVKYTLNITLTNPLNFLDFKLSYLEKLELQIPPR